MENKKTNLIVKKLRFSKEEYRKKYTSFVNVTKPLLLAENVGEAIKLGTL